MAQLQENTNLHVHSDYSDGDFSPRQLLSLAVESNLKHMSITDHNSLDAYWEIFQEKNAIGITIGTELTCKHYIRSLEKEIVLHLCAYFPSRPEETMRDTFAIISPMRKICSNAAAGINTRRKIQIKKLQKAGFALEEHDVWKEATAQKANPESAVMLDVKDIAKVVSKGNNLPFEETVQMLKHNHDFYVSAREDWQCYNIKELAKKISTLGGIACLAHPTRRIPLEAMDETIGELSCFGINAIEAYNHTNKLEEEAIIGIAKKYSLLVTTGNDFHGLELPINPAFNNETISLQLARSKKH